MPKFNLRNVRDRVDWATRLEDAKREFKVEDVPENLDEEVTIFMRIYGKKLVTRLDDFRRITYLRHNKTNYDRINNHYNFPEHVHNQFRDWVNEQVRIVLVRSGQSDNI
jgi:hypothetical protein